MERDEVDAIDAGPPLGVISPLFAVYETRLEGETLLYYGTPRVPPEPMMNRLWQSFREEGYEAHLTMRHGEYVIVAEPVSTGIDEIPWTNLVLFFATVLSTLFVGAGWYYVDPFADPMAAAATAWPFTVAILGVLGVHEMGHYVMSRYHGVDASLPYFLPVPTLIGTMGAVISIKSRMPNRKALFDIGVAGPLAGLVATVVVTVVGLHLEPVTAPSELVNDPNAVTFSLGYPPMLEFLAWAVDQPLYRDDPSTVVNPVVIGGWVGMFVTFLNMIPVGQLDGGHILRAMTREYQETIASAVPGVLFALAGYLYYVSGYGFQSVFVWILWGAFALFFVRVGPAKPVDDQGLGRGRFALGLVTFVLGALCFMPVPIEIVG